MTKQTSRKLLFLASCAFLATILVGCCCLSRFCKDRIIIITPPQSQTLPIGSNVTFTVLAVKGGPPYTTNGLSYQWQFNGTILDGNLHWTNLTISGATNSPSITVTNAQLSNVGYYRVLVSGSPTETSAAAALQLTDPTRGPMPVYGLPVAYSSSKGLCPGAYVGYIKFTNNPPTNWGWSVINRSLKCTASNGQQTGIPMRSDTSVEYLGKPMGDAGCNANSVDVPANFTQPSPPLPVPRTPSSNYWFTLYFRQTPLPTGPYPLMLDNLQ